MRAPGGQKTQGRERPVIELNVRFVGDIKNVWVWSFRKSGLKAGVGETLACRC